MTSYEQKMVFEQELLDLMSTPEYVYAHGSMTPPTEDQRDILREEDDLLARIGEWS